MINQSMFFCFYWITFIKSLSMEEYSCQYWWSEPTFQPPSTVFLAPAPLDYLPPVPGKYSAKYFMMWWCWWENCKIIKTYSTKTTIDFIILEIYFILWFWMPSKSYAPLIALYENCKEIPFFPTAFSLSRLFVTSLMKYF